MELNDKIKKMEEKLKALELSNQLELKVSTQDSASTTMELNDKIKKMEEKLKALCNIAAEEHQKKYKERNIPTNLELSNQIKELEVDYLQDSEDGGEVESSLQYCCRRTSEEI